MQKAYVLSFIQFNYDVIWINSTTTVYNKWERNNPTKAMETRAKILTHYHPREKRFNCYFIFIVQGQIFCNWISKLPRLNVHIRVKIESKQRKFGELLKLVLPSKLLYRKDSNQQNPCKLPIIKGLCQNSILNE